MIDMSPTKKRTPKPRIVHSCTQEENLKRQGELLDRLATVTLGNGHPEDGLLFMFRVFLKERDEMKADIKEIKGKVDDAIGASDKTKHALELYQAEMGGVSNGKKEGEAKLVIQWDKVIRTIGTIIAAVGITIAAWGVWSKGGHIEDKVNNMSTPVIIDKYGQIKDARGIEVKMFPEDYKKQDTSKTKK
jgi:hypothetical protein